MVHWKRETLWGGPLDGLVLEIKTDVQRIAMGKGYCDQHGLHRQPIYQRSPNQRMVFDGYVKEEAGK